MAYLVLTRQRGERLQLSIRDGADDAALLEQLRSGGIYIDVLEIGERNVRIGLDAPKDILILREEVISG
ncbi:carbon storage regulator [Pseudomonas sp. XK-1]|uniref:carbon storage regulator n=1 Tax=Pseudomonas sp. XK-1 TaxID=3136019 RepID=UPI003119932F